MKKVAVIPGDGIGPEVIGATLEVLKKVGPGQFEFQSVAMGGNAIDKYGEPMPAESLRICQEADIMADPYDCFKFMNELPEKYHQMNIFDFETAGRNENEEFK